MMRRTLFAGLVLLLAFAAARSEVTEPRAVASGTNTRLRLNESCVLNPVATARGPVTEVGQRPGAGGAAASSERTLTVVTEPAAIVWLDEVRRGTTNESGKLALSRVTVGAHTLRVRANGFKEITMPVAATARGEISVRLTKTADQAELIFQRAETARESARTDESRQQAGELYRQALQARAAFPAAHVGLARVLLDLNNSDGALQAIEAARGTRPVYPEASAVEGRIYRELGQNDEAIGSFNRAIRESRGFQPEAHVGLGRIYEEKGEYELSAREFQIAINQLSDTEPIVYQMLGAAYEKANNPKDAIVAYENYLRLAPNGSLAPAVRSIVEQLKSEPRPN